MATYIYRCKNCEHELELEQSMKDEPITLCPSCDTEMLRRVVTGGNGFRIHGKGVHKPTSRLGS